MTGPRGGEGGSGIRDEVLTLRADLAARERSEMLLRAALEAVDGPVSARDDGGRYVAANRAAARLLGREPGEVVGRDDPGLLPPEAACLEVEADRRVAASGRAESSEVVAEVEGEPRTFLMTRSPLRDDSGRVVGVATVGRDVTAHRGAGGEPGRGDRLFRAVFEGASDAIVVADDRGLYTDANPAAADLFGVPGDALIGLCVRDFAEPGFDYEAAWRAFRERGRASGEFRLVRPDGTRRDAHCASTADVVPGRHLSVLRDVTELLRAERALRESERMAQSILDSLPSQIAVLDEAGAILAVNHAWRQFAREHGTDPGAVGPGVNYLGACTLGAEAIAFGAGIRDVLAGRRDAFDQIYPCHSPEGPRWFLGRVTPIQAEGSRRVVVTHEDVSERLALEVSQRRQADRLANLRRIDLAILARHSPGEVARAAIGPLRALVPCWQARIVMFDPDTGRAEVLASEGTASALVPPGEEFPLEHLGPDDIDALLSGRDVVVADVSRLVDPPATIREMVPLGLRSYARVPLAGEGELLGCLTLFSDREEAFDDDQMEVAREVADTVTIAIRHARLFEAIGEAGARTEALSRRLIEAEEAERRRIARELHDEMGQALAAVKIDLRTALRDPSAPTARDRIADALALIERTIGQVRALSLDLRPSMLDDLGLVPALRSFCTSMAARLAIEVRFEADPAIGRLDPEVETACYRIAQEALNNVAKHAGASRVAVELRPMAVDLLLSVDDDGSGFDPDAAAGRPAGDPGFGLTGILERAALLGGRVAIESAPGRGTRLRATLPLQRGPATRPADDAED